MRLHRHSLLQSLFQKDETDDSETMEIQNTIKKEYPNMNAEIIRFLDDLRRNNNTVWFHENRERYDKLRCAFINEVQELIERISVFDPDIRGLDARKCLFRINRDIRFSLTRLICQPVLLKEDVIVSGELTTFILNRNTAYCPVVSGIPNRKY